MLHLTFVFKPHRRFEKLYKEAVAFVERVFEYAFHKPYKPYEFSESLKYSGVSLSKT